MKFNYVLCLICLLATTISAVAKEITLVTMTGTREYCIPCEGGVAPLSAKETADFMEGFPEWTLIKQVPQKIERTFNFKNFVEAMNFVNSVAEVAEKEGHHPDIYIFYNKVTLQLYTHAINGLSANDFIIAGLIDDIIFEKLIKGTKLTSSK